MFKSSKRFRSKHVPNSVPQNKNQQLMRAFLITLVVLISIGPIAGQKFIDHGSKEFIPLEVEESYIIDNLRMSDVTGFPLNIRGINQKVSGESLESKARAYLSLTKESLGLTEELIKNNLKLLVIRYGLSGDVVRLQQHYDGIPVYNAQITIHINKKSEVTYVANSWKYGYNSLVMKTPFITAESALTKALEQIGIKTPAIHDEEKLLVYVNPIDDKSALVYRYLLSGQDHSGDWEVLIDVHTGEVVKSQNLSYNCKSPERHSSLHQDSVQIKKSQALVADGLGNVFDPDPITSGTATYGDTGYTDNADGTSSQMTAQLSNVVLKDLKENGGNFELKGPWAEIIDNEAPFKGLFSQPNSTFNYDRTDDNFEAVMVYYHIDASMRYLNETLGLSIRPYQYVTGVRVDPSGKNGADNSSYNVSSGSLSFGEGGVDDAEDSDVIHHELGHGLHDWVTSGSLSQVDGLSEGSGDYWAASYNRSIDSWTPSDPAYFHTFRWDGHNQYWGGRSVNYRPNAPSAPYPGGLVSAIHTDGQIWATCMMDVWDDLGKAKTDMIFWEGLGMTNGSTNQDDAANAVYQAAIDMNFSRSDLVLIHTPLEACGYDLPDLPPCLGTLDLTGTVTMDTSFYSSSKITSGQTITGGAVVVYQAGTEIEIDLLQVDIMSTLLMNVENCTPAAKH